ncbi:hypothetical protein, variant [Aphanomyces invadans]|nr:hypothetical protein, variant [Aphanomyces invadans]ETW02823.1 hypothetical protein, variant [Aphanomyces invadans]|eukprot:XP_008868207.1 hypothetical protein, variant [Aphanomyces invadans]
MVVLDQLACFTMQLEVLHVTECVMQSPLDVLRHGGSWSRLTMLKIVHSDLREWFPDEMLRVSAIQQLDLSNNRLAQLHTLPARSNLQRAILSHNRLKLLSLPEPYPKLTWLALDHNAFESLRSLPWSNLVMLEHLDVSFNCLNDLADVSVLNQLEHLRTLKLMGNPMAAVPDYRRQVLFYLGDVVELDQVAWTWTELDSMRFSRHNKGTTGPLTYPLLPSKPMQMQARMVQIQEPPAPYLSMIRKPRAHSAAFSEGSMVSSVGRTSVASECEVPMSPASSRQRALSYHVDEFLRDLADEMDPDVDDMPVEFEHVMPPTTPGMIVTIFLSMEQADSLDLPLSREGLTGLVHVTPTKLMEYLPGGGVIQRHRAHLLCMAVFTTNDAHHMTIQLGFRHRPTVAYKVSDTATAVKLVRAMHETLADKSNLVAFKCKACGALVISRERLSKSKMDVLVVLAVQQCWICKSSNGREYAAETIPQCYLDLGLDVVDTALPTTPFLGPHANREFYIDAEYDDGGFVGGRDEIIWVVTDTFMKEVKVAANDVAPEDDNGSTDVMAATYRRWCGT